MILYGAAAKIGAIILAVNWRFQPDEVQYVLKNCTPKNENGEIDRDKVKKDHEGKY